MIQILCQDLEYFQIVLIFRTLENLIKKKDLHLARGSLCPLFAQVLRQFSSLKDWNLDLILSFILDIRNSFGYLYWDGNDEEENLLLTICLLSLPKLEENKELRVETSWTVANNIISSELWNEITTHDDFFVSSGLSPGLML